MSDKVKLSLRVRPDSEVPRWVHDEILALEAEHERMKSEAVLIAEKCAEALTMQDKAIEHAKYLVGKRFEDAQWLHDTGQRVVDALRERDEARAEAARLQEQVDWLLEGRQQEEQRQALEIDERSES